MDLLRQLLPLIYGLVVLLDFSEAGVKGIALAETLVAGLPYVNDLRGHKRAELRIALSLAVHGSDDPLRLLAMCQLAKVALQLGDCLLLAANLQVTLLLEGLELSYLCLGELFFFLE